MRNPQPKTHEPPYDGYEIVTNPDRVDEENVGRLQERHIRERGWVELFGLERKAET